MRAIFAMLNGAIGSWMLISPQSLTGLSQLKWMYGYAFPGEVLVGIVFLSVAYRFLPLKPPPAAKGH
jgi:hypothetical protein